MYRGSSFQEVGVPLCTEVSSFQGVGIVGFHHVLQGILLYVRLDSSDRSQSQCRQNLSNKQTWTSAFVHGLCPITSAKYLKSDPSLSASSKCFLGNKKLSSNDCSCWIKKKKKKKNK